MFQSAPSGHILVHIISGLRSAERFLHLWCLKVKKFPSEINNLNQLAIVPKKKTKPVTFDDIKFVNWNGNVAVMFQFWATGYSGRFLHMLTANTKNTWSWLELLPFNVLPAINQINCTYIELMGLERGHSVGDINLVWKSAMNLLLSHLTGSPWPAGRGCRLRDDL